jgi:hypothetical protein
MSGIHTPSGAYALTQVDYLGNPIGGVSSWRYAAAAGGLLNTTSAVAIKAAETAGLKNYITSIQITAEALGAATEVAIRDGSAGPVLWRTKIGTAGLIGGLNIVIPPGAMSSSTNTLLEVVTLTASVTGAVYVNVQGYVGV